jgi:hypothetical protein
MAIAITKMKPIEAVQNIQTRDLRFCGTTVDSSMVPGFLCNDA